MSIGVTVFSNESQQGIYCASYSGSFVEKYVNNYKNYFESIGVLINSARLITIEELVELGCSTSDYTCVNSYDWVYGRRYWTGTRVGVGEDNIWYVNKDGHLGGSFHHSFAYFGVRPVIEISLSQF